MDNSQFQKLSNPEISHSQLTHLIKNRRSIRNYKQDPISEEHISIMMNAVRYIPTGSNAQSLKYTIITDPEILLAIKNKNLDNIS